MFWTGDGREARVGSGTSENKRSVPPEKFLTQSKKHKLYGGEYYP